MDARRPAVFKRVRHLAPSALRSGLACTSLRAAMRLDHLLAADPIGTPLSDAQRARVDAVLGAFAFVRAGDGWQLDEGFAWASVTPVDGLLHVAVAAPLPAHLIDVVHAALDGLVRETGLVRIDPLTRGELTPMDWVQRLAASASAGRGQRS